MNDPSVTEVVHIVLHGSRMGERSRDERAGQQSHERLSDAYDPRWSWEFESFKLLTFEELATGNATWDWPLHPAASGKVSSWL